MPSLYVMPEYTYSFGFVTEHFVIDFEAELWRKCKSNVLEGLAIAACVSVWVSRSVAKGSWDGVCQVIY